MTRGETTNLNKNFLRAKLENFWKGNETPRFVITRWNGIEAVKVWEWDFIEWELKQIDVKGTQYWTYVTFDIEDKENNAIQWGMKLWQTMRNILFKLYVPASKDIKIKNIMLKTWLYNDKKFVSLFVDWQKYDNPFSRWNEAAQRFDVDPTITEKVRIVKDPETWEIVKKDETKLDEWIEQIIIPTINWSIDSNQSIADKIKEANQKDDDLSDLPFN